MNQNFEKFKQDFKRDLLIKIVISMKHGRVSKDASQELAKRILEIFKIYEVPKVFESINKLSESYPEILDILITRGHEFDKRESEEKLEQIIVYFKTIPTRSTYKGGEN